MGVPLIEIVPSCWRHKSYAFFEPFIFPFLSFWGQDLCFGYSKSDLSRLLDFVRIPWPSYVWDSGHLHAAQCLVYGLFEVHPLEKWDYHFHQAQDLVMAYLVRPDACYFVQSVQSLVKWQPALKSTYEKITTDYLDKLQGPMRLKYPGSGKSSEEGELLTFLTEVVVHPNLPIMLISITVYSLDHWCNTGGQQILQCIWKGHCRGEHLFWKLNCLWFGKVFHNFTFQIYN